METLNNFGSIYCFISFIIGAVFMLATLCIVAISKDKESRNKVRFYVARDSYGTLFLYMGKPTRSTSEFLPSYYGRLINSSRHFSKYGLNEDDYAYLKWEDEPVEVFVNMED